MIEQRPLLTAIAHIIMVLGVLLVAFPIWITFVAATHDEIRMVQAPLPLLPGDQLFVNLDKALFGAGLSGSAPPVWLMLLN